jgi:hypothetical protein
VGYYLFSDLSRKTLLQILHAGDPVFPLHVDERRVSQKQAHSIESEEIRRYLSYGTDADRDGPWLRKLPPLGSAVPTMSGVVGRGKLVGRHVITSNAILRRLTCWSASKDSTQTLAIGKLSLAPLAGCCAARWRRCCGKKLLPGASLGAWPHKGCIGQYPLWERTGHAGMAGMT